MAVNLITTADYNKTMPNLIGNANAGVHCWDVALSPTIKAGTTATPIENYTRLNAPNTVNARASIDWSSGMQVLNGNIGAFLNGFATPTLAHPTLPGKFVPHWSCAAYKNNLNSYPWANPAEHLHFGVKLQIGQCYVANGDGCQVYVGLHMRIRGQYRVVIVLLWDSRAGTTPGAEYPYTQDVYGSRFIGTYVGGNAKGTTNFGVGTTDGTAIRDNQMYFDITHANLDKLLGLFGYAPGEIAHNEVCLDGVTFQGELFGPSTKQYKDAQFGFNIKNQVVSVW